ncbi:YadA family autotransporter adhesin, partial [Luteimonas aquatica]|uniref:YadA family autotransporter adhesin n=1 Tax=Luteimonas aquatica TaxID=450364 RepID=UPI001F58AD82
GYGAYASGVNSVAIGTLSEAERANTVSIGSAGNERQLTNVAAGTEDTDAVNKGQLDEVAAGVANAVSYDDESKDSITLEGENGTKIGNLAAGDVSANSTQAVNGGQLYGALDSTAAALGGGASVTAFGTISAPTYLVQGGSYFNVGDAISALDASISQIDQRLSSVESNGLAAGASTDSTGDDRATASSKPARTGADAGSTGGGTGPVASSNAPAAGTGAMGGVASGTNAVAMGQGAVASGASSTAIGQGATASAANSVALGQGSVADRANTVSVGSVGNERQVVNVADGTQATDAVNKRQMDASATKTLSSANAYTDSKFMALEDSFDVLKDDMNRRLRDQDRRIDRQGAMSAAMLNMATSAAGIRTENRVGVGVGFQGGQSALSIGYQRAISDRATFTLGGATSGGDTSVGLGAGFGW